MKIAIEASWVGHRPTGIGWYVHQLLSTYAGMDLPHRFVLLHATPAWHGPDYGPTFETAGYGVLGKKLPGLAAGLNRVLRRTGADLYHATFTTDVPPHPCVPVCTTVHDLFPLLHPADCPVASSVLFRWMLRWSLAGTTRFIANSSFTAGQLARLPGVSPDRIETVLLAPVPVEARGGGPAGDRSPDDDGPPIALCLGAVEPRKGQTTLARAWALLARRRSDLPELVFAGPDRGDGGRLVGLLGRPELKGKARWAGYVDDATRTALLRRASMVLVPSRFEGFGLAVLEGMQAGAAVVCSDIPPFKEIAGAAARFVAPQGVRAWSQAVAELLDHPAKRDKLAAAGASQAARFTWRRTASATLAVYEAIRPRRGLHDSAEGGGDE